MGNKKFSVYIPEYREPVAPQRAILDPVATIISDTVDNENDLTSIFNRVDACLLTMNTCLTRAVLEACSGLKVIAKYGVGIDTIDVTAVTEMGITITNTAGINCNAVAELSIGLMITMLRHIHRSKGHLKEGGWKNETFIGRPLSNCEVGIIGYGSIAGLVIHKLKCLGVKRILVYSASVVPTPNIGGATTEARREMVMTVAKNLVRLLTGRAVDPKYVVNPEVFTDRDIGPLKGGDAK